MRRQAIAIATMCATLAGCKVEPPGTLETTVMKWASVLYLRHLPPAGSLGAPHAYSVQ
jgi:hypothetical protein